MKALALEPKPTPKPLPPAAAASEPEERIGGKLPHEVLGVPRGASHEVVHQAYLKLVREYHPDKTAQLATEIQALAGERTRELNRAYELMSRGKKEET
jgi:DnaJ-class molecular chaperone